MTISKALASVKFTIYHGSIVHTPKFGEIEFILNARVGVDKEGTIAYIKKEPLVGTVLEEAKNQVPGLKEEIEVQDITGHPLRFFFPGFIDAHIHAPQYPNCGAFNNLELMDWMNKYTYPIEVSLGDTQRAEKVYEKTVLRTLESGTTFCAYFATRHLESTKILTDKAFAHGQRTYIARSCQDKGFDYYTDKDLGDALEQNQKMHDYIKSLDPDFNVIKPALAPRSADQCSRPLLKKMGEIAEETKLPIQVHMCESDGERKMILDVFPEFKEYSDIYNHHGLLNSRTILGHCVKITESDYDLVSLNRSGIAHCPTSNTSVGSGEAQVRKMLDRGIKVGLGTDISAGFSPSILRTVQYAVLNSIHVAMKSKSLRDKLSVNECLYLATMGGAKVCNMEKKVGSFAVGKSWDAQYIDLTKSPTLDIFDFQVPDMEKVQKGDESEKEKFQDVVDKWVFTGNDRNTRKVYVNGRCVINKGS